MNYVFFLPIEILALTLSFKWSRNKLFNLVSVLLPILFLTNFRLSCRSMLISIDVIEFSEAVNSENAGLVIVRVSKIQCASRRGDDGTYILLSVAHVIQLFQISFFVIARLRSSKSIWSQDI